MSAARELVLIANTRMPSERAQSLQVAQMSAAFARAGVSCTLVHARRRRELPLPAGQDLFDYYGVSRGARPRLQAVACIDWIERLPPRLQYWPARLQELSFARSAAHWVRRAAPEAWIYTRELESALPLARAASGPRHPRLFLEIHRVPGGRLRRRWLLQAAARSAGVVAISAGVEQDLLELGLERQRVCVAHDGFEAERFSKLPSRAAARAALGLSAQARVAVYTGGLLEWKGVDVLVEAARSVPGLQVLIAGGMAADVQRLRARAAGLANVRIDGFQAPERVSLYLAAGDFGVAPNRSHPEISARYTSPLKVFEAMAAGLPLVASDVPALREILVHERDALLVAPDDPAALAQGLQRMAQDDALRERLATTFAARAWAHTWDARAQTLLAWMEALGAQRGAA